MAPTPRAMPSPSSPTTPTIRARPRPISRTASSSASGRASTRATAHVLVEDCYFQGKSGDNDDVDLWGESTPPCVIRNNIFDLPEHDDRINPTRCSAIIEGNIIMGSDDHGLVLRDKGSPLVINNVIIGCANGGIAVENSCTATLINNTIVGCGRGVRLFDLGRWGPPYRLNPGGGTATLVNCIIWDCPQTITLADTSNTQIADRGSHVTVRYCDIQRGRHGVSVSGSHSTVVWGEGNINADPLFVDCGQERPAPPGRFAGHRCRQHQRRPGDRHGRSPASDRPRRRHGRLRVQTLKVAAGCGVCSPPHTCSFCTCPGRAQPPQGAGARGGAVPS